MKNFTQFWVKPWKYVYAKVKILQPQEAEGLFKFVL